MIGEEVGWQRELRRAAERLFDIERCDSVSEGCDCDLVEALASRMTEVADSGLKEDYLVEVARAVNGVPK